MTFDEALDDAALYLDRASEECRQRFEQSLVDNRAADDLTAAEIDELRAFEREHMADWRVRELDAIRARLLAVSVARVH